MAAARGIVPLLGASLLSGVGSLPSHLTPLIVAALISNSTTSVATAGWIPSALLSGQLFVSLFLPALNAGKIQRGHVICISVALLGALLLSRSADLPILLGCWFLAGGCCGALQFLGTTAAAHHPLPSFAFSLRLGLVLLLAGTVAAGLRVTSAAISYNLLVLCLSLAVGPLLLTGLVLHRPAFSAATPNSEIPKGNWSPFYLAGLAVIFLLFAGQTGFLAYVVSEATKRGVSIGQAAWVIAAMKIAAGACLLCVARVGPSDSRHRACLVIGVLLGASVAVASLTGNSKIFFAGLFGFELAFNVLSARVQAILAMIAPRLAGQSLLGAVLLGAAVGPALHGAAIGFDLGAFFVAFSILSAVAPGLLMWTWTDPPSTPRLFGSRHHAPYSITAAAHPLTTPMIGPYPPWPGASSRPSSGA